MRRLRRFVILPLAVILVLVAVIALTGTLMLRGSLARLDGEVGITGLSAPVTVDRDELGVPDIRAASRLDAARALGYLHGQERFFQMDLLRRAAAGELAALLGPALVSTDRDNRRHRFSTRAEAVVAAGSDADRALLAAYTAGVNRGLDDLGSRPPEYWVFRQRPVPWRPADTVLVLHAMCLDLSLSTAWTDENNAIVRDVLPPALAGLLLPRGNRWEAPLQDDPQPGVIIPDSSDADIRKWTYDGRTWRDIHDEASIPRHDEKGSNNWAVAGHLTAHGGALLANDMHLGLDLPNTWYRARMRWPEGDGERDVVGVTLPGTPVLVAGSNGYVAWGFTNSYGDWVDLVVLEMDPGDASRYRTPDGWRALERIPEIIVVAGSEPDTLVVEQTIWGPVWSADTEGRPLALRWTAHDVEAVNLGLQHLETVRSVDEAAAVAGTVGIPQQNLVCADRDGRIAWTIAGRIPARVGFDGRFPESWADGSRLWDGYRDPALQPRIVDPAEGRLWTANNRVVGGADLAVIGDGDYGLGARARQIRDGLRALDRPDEADMLALQLDARALFLDEWRGLALEVLERHPPEPGSQRAVFAALLRDAWTGRAEPDSAPHRLVRLFMHECVDGVLEIFVEALKAANEDFRPRWLPYRHATTWEILAARPIHLMSPWLADWDEALLGAIDRTLERAGPVPAAWTWGRRNTVSVGHPLARFVPQLEKWLATPPRELPGDSFMPRVQHPSSGASQRLVVSPGREEDGIFHMPGGQSGHPLSPFFTAGHEAWEEGSATPLLPGPTAHTLRLVPAGGP